MSTQTSQLIPSIVAQAILTLQANQAENGGVVDYERFQDETAILLGSVADLEQERDDCITAIKELIEEKQLAERQRNEAKALYERHYNDDFFIGNWSLH